jgi:hypothetical protein
MLRRLSAACALQFLALSALAQGPVGQPLPAGHPLPAAQPLPADRPMPNGQPLPAPALPAPAIRAAPRDAGSIVKPPHAGAQVPKSATAAAEARSKLRQKIRAIRSRKLAAVIQPDAETMLKLAEIAEKFEEQLEQVRQQAHVTRKDLLKAMQAAKPDDALVSQLTQQFIAQRAKLQEIETGRENAVRAVLKPVDFARLVLAWPKINREIREEIYRVLSKKAARDDEI